jgi:hypothetical protein
MPGPLKKAFFYTVPYILFFALAELVLYLLYITEDQQTCTDKYTTYGYCAGYSEVHNISREKQEYTDVNVYVDELGGRQPGPEPSVFPGKSRVFIIGDSFVQADELPYQMTMGGVLNDSSVPAYALGYSSWNPIQYAGAIKKLGGLEGEYHVFMFINDFMPSNDRSVSGELNAGKLQKSVWDRLIGISRLAALVDRKWQKIAAANKASLAIPDAENQYQALTGDSELSFTREAFRQCGDVAAIWDKSLMSDILMFSKHYSCWPDEFRQQVDMAVAATRKLAADFSADGDGESHLHLYLIPPGWALPDQNTAGRVHPTLGVDTSATISQIGLADYLQYNGLKVMDLEPFLQERLDSMKADCGRCENALYFEHDGHWTSLTNKLVAQELLQ